METCPRCAPAWYKPSIDRGSSFSALSTAASVVASEAPVSVTVSVVKIPRLCKVVQLLYHALRHVQMLNDARCMESTI